MKLRKPKAENDERFMLERDAAREDASRLAAALEGMMTPPEETAPSVTWGNARAALAAHRASR